MNADFEKKLEKYAGVIVKIGVNLQPGQRLFFRAPIEQAPLVRHIARVAYEIGSPYVEVLWSDDALTLARFKYAPRDSFSEVAQWRYDALEQAIKNGEATLSLFATNPRLLEEQDTKLVGEYQQATMKAYGPIFKLFSDLTTNGSVFAAPHSAWNQQVFPLMTPEEAEAAMWETIFKICRIDQPDPVAAWETHVEGLAERANYLTQKQYTMLKYTAPGTDLTVGLPGHHLWVSGLLQAKNLVPFVPNMPTEEIFTLPHRERIDGHVTSTKPLSYGGQTMENFTLTFEKGRVVKATAEKGETQLLQLLDTDEGTRSLGEVALVPHSSPISQTGLVFNNGLIDENASCHLALGFAHRFTLAGGTNMSDKAFAAAGGNTSNQHLDFMMGSDEMDIDGITTDGTAEPVFRKGEWAFEV